MKSSTSEKTIILMVTRQCNLSCWFCPFDFSDESMSFETAARILDSIVPLFQENIHVRFLGGEPLLNRDTVIKTLTHSSQCFPDNVTFDLTTNALLLDDEFLRDISSHPVELVVSMDEEKKNSAIISELPFRIGTSLDLSLNVTISPERTRLLVSNLEKAYEWGYRKFNFLPAYYVQWNEEQLASLRKSFKSAAEFILHKGDIIVKNESISSRMPLFNEGMIIDVNGDVYYSNIIFTQKYRGLKEQFFIGNIWNSTGAEIVRNFSQFDFESASREVLMEEKNKSSDLVDACLTHFVRNQLFRSAPIQSMPEKCIDIKLGYNCSNNCVFCAAGDKRKFLKSFGLDRAREFVDAAAGVSEIVFSGGEPTLVPFLPEIIRYAQESGIMNITLQTNARTFAYAEYCKSIVAAGVSHFMVSLHGDSPALHDSLTLSEGSFRQAVAGIINLLKAGADVSVNVVVTSLNFRRLSHITRLVSILGVRKIQFSFVHIIGTAEKNASEIVPSMTEVMPFLREAIDKSISSGLSITTEAFPHCILEGYHVFAVENADSFPVLIERKAPTGQEMGFVKIHSGREKAEKCASCIFNNNCQGPWVDYTKMFGWDEFIPLKK